MSSNTSRRQFLKSIPLNATAAWAAGLSILKPFGVLDAHSQPTKSYAPGEPATEWPLSNFSTGAGALPGGSPVRFPISKSQTDAIHGVGYMHTDISISSSGQLSATTHTWSAKDLEGFHGSVAVVILDQNQRLLWVSRTESYGVDGKHVPFGGPSDRTDRWSDNIPTGELSQIHYVAIKQNWNPKPVGPDEIANWLRGVGNGVGNELKAILQEVETTAAIVGQDLSTPTIEYADARGYRYDETSGVWKQTCTAFPCCAELHWPGYATKWFPTIINNQPVVIQLWKGNCEKFLGLEKFPGGIGAEVGVYRFEPGRTRPRALPFLPPSVAAAFLKPIASLNDKDLWWAYPELGTEIHFILTNPITNQIFFSTGTEKTYWLNKWMQPESYEKYKRAGRTPPSVVDYRLDYSINGRSYQSW